MKERRKEGKKETRKERKKERRKEGKKERRKKENKKILIFLYLNPFFEGIKSCAPREKTIIRKRQTQA